VSFTTAYGELKFRALADVLDASGGHEISASYGYPFTLGGRLVLTPGVGAKWLSVRMGCNDSAGWQGRAVPGPLR